MKKVRSAIFMTGAFLLISVFANADSTLKFTQKTLSWQQVDSLASFTVFSDRDIYSNLDKDGRIVFALQIGKKKNAELAKMHVVWKITDEAGKTMASSDVSLAKGMAYVDFSPASLVPGDYAIEATFFDSESELQNTQSAFSVVKEAAPKRSGTIPIYFPIGVHIENTSYPITCGVPFPKGALFSPDNVQLLNASGKVVPCQTIVRSRWGHSDKSSIRWLGLDFQSPAQPAWNRKSKKGSYQLKYGSKVKLQAVVNPIKINNSESEYIIDTGKAQFVIKKKGFNLFDKVILDGKNLIMDPTNSGLYLIDHKGNIYRSANDKESKATIEEQGMLRSVIRVEGWYVKDGTDGKLQSYSLPTDKLCKFVTRLEFYAGKSYVRVLSTWIITFDIFSVKLKDLGINIPMGGIENATFGIENALPFSCDISKQSVYLIQHLHNRFDIETGDKTLKSGKHSAGWFSAGSPAGTVTASLRAAWQRYPKEFEVLPDMLRIHIWPVHGKDHPEINEISHQNLTRILYAHQGKEMSLAMPWKYYLAASKILDTDKTGVYSATGQVLAGVHSGALGCAITSDMLIEFSSTERENNALQVAECFQKRPHALADPAWNCASKALGWIHPYNKKQFPVMENIIEEALKGYEKTNDETEEYGMWIYRRWHHSGYLGDKKWNLYRMHNTTHHYEAFLPWLFYFRSGDPFYFQQGNDHTRNLADVGIIHYEDPKYPQKELHFYQKRLIGSTKHTNGFVPWGADHGVGGHMTCYNGLITAYYLTGDLRYKEVVIDEWEKTITDRRDNPEYPKADRSRNTDGSIKGGQKIGARDVDCFIGELIDLYQLTYNPKVLALLGLRIPVMENNPITDWGMPLQNVIQFYGSRKLRKDLTDVAEEYSSTGMKPENDLHSFWYYGNASHMPITLASILNRNKQYALAAYHLAAPYNKTGWSKQIKTLATKGPAFFTVPDVILKYPHLMLACNITECDTRATLSQPMPLGDIKQKGWMRCLIKEDRDGDIVLKINGLALADIPVVVFDPDNKQIISTELKKDLAVRKPIVIPKDKKNGVYTLFILAKDGQAKFRIPISDLPEVYCVKYWSQPSSCRLFINFPDNVDRKITITPHKSFGTITTRSGNEVLAETKIGEQLTVVIPEDGIWFTSKARYISLDTMAIMAVSPERWFTPPKDKLDLPIP